MGAPGVGQVWTQNQCFSHPTIKRALGKNRPENIVKLSERYLWVIEAKAARRDIEKAVDEARRYYSKPINDLNGDVEAIMASGVAGDEAAGYIVRTFIRLHGSWQTVTINGQEATGLLTPSDVQFLLEHKTNDIHEFSPPQWLFLQAAERINGGLHLGGINKNDRAKTMAALLLAVVEDAPNLDTDLPVLIGVSSTDIALDPACGTGGFLVAAFDYVRRNSTTTQLDRFKQHNLFGIEQESYIVALAIVNMIFRGDGKNGITEGNCFTTNLVAASVDGHPSAAYSKTEPKPGTEPVTRVLMNPPFALQGSVDQEYKFVSRALATMADGGLLFSLVPLDCLFGAHEEKIWRTSDLLAKHTLLAVVTLPHELFYPAALTQVAGIIVRKGSPHPKDQPVFWGRIAADGHLKVKSKRLNASDLQPPREAADDIPKVLPLLRSYIAHPGATTVNEPMLYKTAAIDFSDPLLELMPEAYLDSPIPTEAELEQAVNQMARDTAAFLIRFGKEATAEAYK